MIPPSDIEFTHPSKSFPYASHWRRLCAGLIDLLLIAIIWTLLIVFDGVPGGAIAVIITLGYLVIMDGANHGRTLGKIALAIRVIREDGGEMTWNDALMREIVCRAVPLLLTALFYWPFDVIFIIINDRRQALHDNMAHTLVIDSRQRAVAYTDVNTYSSRPPGGPTGVA